MTRSASLRTAKWCDIDGLVMSNDDASSPAVRSPCPSSRRISRRVGSDNALNTSFSAIMTSPFARAERLFRSLSNYRLVWFPGQWRERHSSRLLELDPARADSGRHVGEEIADERVWIVGDDEGVERTRVG